MSHSWLPILAVLITATSAAVVKTSNGTVQGGRCTNTGSNYFLSIPFADPPVGELRYQTPQPLSRSYNGTLDGTKQAPSCYQFGTTSTLSGPQSEDCLYLNIYAPVDATSTSALPVKIWLYGGAFETGGSSDPLYNGCFSSTDAIVVTVNYRLGPLGYLALENTTFTGNYGILDQLQAIRWVHDNVAAFGGNPEQILLFGQSAGAMASFALATLPEIPSLINAVVMESGGGIDFPTISSAQTFHENFVRALNCSVTDVNCVRSRTPAQLNDTYNHLPTSGIGFAFTLNDWSGAAFPWSPLAGSSLFKVQPSEVGVQVPALFGSNALEGSILALQSYGAANVSNLTTEDYMTFLTVNFGEFASEVFREYPPPLFRYSVFEAMSIVVRDYTFRCPAYRGLSLGAAKGVPVWTYGFNQTPSCPWAEGLPPDLLRILGAAHATEIPFVFGEVSNLPQPNGKCNFTAGERSISIYMQSAWTSLATRSTPGQWPLFTPNSTIGINFQNGSIVPGVVDYSMCAFWNKIDMAILRAAGANTVAVAINGSNATASPTTFSGGASTVAPSMLCLLAVTVLVIAGSITDFP